MGVSVLGVYGLGDMEYDKIRVLTRHKLGNSDLCAKTDQTKQGCASHCVSPCLCVSSDRLKCPYCPMEQNPSDAKQIYFWCHTEGEPTAKTEGWPEARAPRLDTAPSHHPHQLLVFLPPTPLAPPLPFSDRRPSATVLSRLFWSKSGHGRMVRRPRRFYQ